IDESGGVADHDGVADLNAVLEVQRSANDSKAARAVGIEALAGIAIDLNVAVDVSRTAVDLDADIGVVVDANGGAVVRFGVGVERAAVVQNDTDPLVARDIDIGRHSADPIPENNRATVTHLNA